MERATKKNKTWKAVIAVVVVALPVAAIWMAWPRERLLLEVARPIAKVNPWKVQVCWLSADQLLLVTTYQPAIPSGTRKGNLIPSHWQGSADLVNTSTGMTTRLTGLTDLLQRTVVYPTIMPCGFHVSPDGSWLLWDKLDSGNGLPMPCAARLDGTHYRTWSTTDREAGLYLDAGHLAQVTNGKPLIIVRDLMDPTQDRTYDTLEQGRAVLGPYSRRQPAFTVIAYSADTFLSSFAELNTYRMQDHLEFLLNRRDNPFTDPPAPMQTRSINWPAGAQPNSVNISLQQTSLFYFVGTARPPLLWGWLHRILPGLVKLPTTKELWVSRLDGGRMQKIGSAQLPPDAKRNPYNFEFNDFKWLPDGKQISFIYRGTLSVVPAEPGKQ